MCALPGKSATLYGPLASRKACATKGGPVKRALRPSPCGCLGEPRRIASKSGLKYRRENTNLSEKDGLRFRPAWQHGPVTPPEKRATSLARRNKRKTTAHWEARWKCTRIYPLLHGGARGISPAHRARSFLGHLVVSPASYTDARTRDGLHGHTALSIFALLCFTRAGRSRSNRRPTRPSRAPQASRSPRSGPRGRG